MTTIKDAPKIKTYKSVEWSYPTSTNAKRFGFPKGCWTVSLEKFANGAFTAKATAGFATRDEAVNAAAALPEPWAPWGLDAIEGGAS